MFAPIFFACLEFELIANQIFILIMTKKQIHCLKLQLLKC
jgi:hypothetical protein